MNVLISIRKAWGVSWSIVQEEENFKGYLHSLTLSLQFLMEFTGIRFKQACCNPSFLIRSPYNRQTLLWITLECSRVFWVIYHQRFDFIISRYISTYSSVQWSLEVLNRGATFFFTETNVLLSIRF
jgi:hypothetical protein